MKNMNLWPGEKYAFLGPAKKMHFWFDEKYALLGPTKNALPGRRKICTSGQSRPAEVEAMASNFQRWWLMKSQGLD
jgi:hypothetical protein